MTQIKRRVIERYCPCCGYIVSQSEIERLRCDIQCPRCEQYKFSDFQIRKWSDHNDTN